MSSPANHYMPGDEILCGPRPSSGTYTDDPRRALGCAVCVEAAAKDMKEFRDNVEHRLRCLHCGKTFGAQILTEWVRLEVWPESP